MSEITESVELLRAESLCKAYGGRTVLTDLSLSVSKGEIYGILGPIGSGKTTLMEILSGSISADTGAVWLADRCVGPEEKESKAKIGYMPEKAPFYRTMTVMETLDFIGSAKGVDSERRYRQIKEALDLVGLTERQNRQVGALSEEEVKRLSLGGALLGNPELLLLDEPLSSVSEGKREEMLGLIRMLGRIKTIVLATATFSTVKALCENVTILSDGSVLAQGSMTELDERLRRSEQAATLEAVYRDLMSASVKSSHQSKEESDGMRRVTRKTDKEGER